MCLNVIPIIPSDQKVVTPFSQNPLELSHNSYVSISFIFSNIMFTLGPVVGLGQ